MPAARRALPIVILVAVTWLVFWPVVEGQFVGWDDVDLVVNNPGLNPPSLEKTADFWRGPYMRLYTPLAYTAWAAIAAMEHVPGGQSLSPWPFHLFNLLLHTAAAVFAYLLLRKLIDSVWAALMGALLFAVHPLQVEPVAWVGGMNNLLFGALALAALWQYMLFVKGEPARAGHLALATFLYALALLSKPTAVVVPLVAVVIDIAILQRSLRRAFPLLFLWTAMAIPIALVAHRVQAAPPAPGPSSPVISRIVVAADAIGFYAIKVAAPLGLTMDYERFPHWVIQHPRFAWVGFAILLMATGIYLARRVRWMIAPLVISGVALLPVLGIVRFDFQDYSTVADRYMYLPMFGVSLLAAGALSRSNSRVVWVLACAAIFGLGARSVAQVRVWHDTDSLVASQLAFDPDSSTAHKIKGFSLYEQNRFDEAEWEFLAAIATYNRGGGQDDGAVRYDYANMLLKEDRLRDAIRMYDSAIPRLSPPRRALAYYNLGLADYDIGDIAGARRQFGNALLARPDYAEARISLDRLNAESAP